MPKRAQLQLRLLGRRMAGRVTAAFDSGAAVPVGIVSQKACALLYFTAMQKESCATRSELATLLWGERTDALARQSLRQCLTQLRQTLAAIAPDLVIVERDTLALRRDCLRVDAWDFESLAGSGELAHLERAAALYGGEFLAGETAQPAAFSEWVDQERMRLQTLASRAFEECARQCDVQRKGEQAIDAALRLTGLDPLREDWQRLLLQMYARYRNREAALAHARTVVALLRRELAVEPAPATTRLIAAVERGEVAGETAVAAPVTEKAHPLPLPPDPVALVTTIRSSSFAKPSIAVLPFAVTGAGCDESFFAEGLRVEIVSALSHIRALAVAARLSATGYTGRPADEKKDARQFDVDYLVKGSIRQTGERLRVTIALIETNTAHHVFCRSYDAVPGDVFAAQDEIAAKFSAFVEPAIYAVEGRRAFAQPPEALDARACVMRALALINVRSKRNYALAQKLLGRAIALSPDCVQAYGLTAYVAALEVVYGWRPRERTMPRAHHAAVEAVLRDAEEPWAYFALGFVQAQSRATEPSIECFRKAIALNPSFSLAYTYLGSALSHLGRTGEALAQIDQAERLSPREFFFGVNNYVRANAFFAAGNHELASAFAGNSVNDSPGIVTSHRHLVVNNALRGEIAAAKAALRRLRKLVPSLSLKSIEEALPYSRDADKTRFLEAFYRLGIK